MREVCQNKLQVIGVCGKKVRTPDLANNRFSGSGLRRRRFLGGIRFLATSGVGFFVRLRKSNWIIFASRCWVGNSLICYNFLWNLLKQGIAVYHDFHWVLDATKFLTAKIHSLYVKELEILERLEWDILPPQPCLGSKKFQKQILANRSNAITGISWLKCVILFYMTYIELP